MIKRLFAKEIMLMAILPISSMTFFFSLIISAYYFYSQRKLDLSDAIISDLQSPIENPRGYLFASLGTAVSALALIPLIKLFNEKLWGNSSRAAILGTIIFSIGIIGAILIGGLSPFPSIYETFHIPLAFATFISIVAGILVYLLIIAYSIYQINRKLAYLLGLLFTFKFTVLAALIYIFFIPGFFTGESLLKSLAFWEWSLCISIVGHLFLLTIILEGNVSRRSSI